MRTDIKDDLSQNKLIHARVNLLTPLLEKSQGVKLFPQPLEAEFQFQYRLNNVFATKLTLFLGLILFAASGIFDLLFFTGLPTLTIRLYITTPILLILFLLFYINNFLRIQQLFIITYVMIVMISLVTIAAYIPVYYKDLIYQSLLLCVLFVSVLPKLQFRYSLLVLLQIILIFNIGYLFSNIGPAKYYYWSLLANNYILIAGAGLCAIACYIGESHDRNKFIYDQLLTEKNKLLNYRSRYDELTNVPNRRYFNEIMDIEWHRALRFQHPLAVFFIDFDYFKQYNDLYGHQAGDKALISVAQVLVVSLRRAGDFVARYGGDEFIVVLPDTTIDKAVEIAKIMKLHLKNLAIEHAGSKISNVVSVTFGISSTIPSADSLPDVLLKQADFALQYGKNTNRDHIYIYNKNEVTLAD